MLLLFVAAAASPAVVALADTAGTAAIITWFIGVVDRSEMVERFPAWRPENIVQKYT